MMLQLNDVILERKFEVVDAVNKPEIIQLRLGKPYLAPESSHSLKWRCPYQITGIGLDTIKEGPGMDALDSVLISLRIAEALLKSYAHLHRKKITWLGEDDLGLSVPSEMDISDEDKNLFKLGESPYNKIFDEFFSKRNTKNDNLP